MRKLISLTALALALSLPTVAGADDNGRGNGGDKDKNKSERGDDRGNGNGNGRGRANGDADRGNRGNGRADRDDRPVVVVRDVERDRDGRGREAVDRRDRDGDRRVVAVDDGRIVYLRRDDDRRVIVGCPPGLAKKDNGCLPPGQARKLDRVRYDYLWGSRDDDYRYRYDDGYLYRTNQQGSLLGYIPVLGGALSMGNLWPSQYDYQQVPSYLSSYYGLNDQYDYRYADGAVYGLDPKTQAISQVVALLTGQQFNVGQTMPAGYDVYNVPYQYRDQYMDTADSMYRYNDGNVYQVDPTTRIVQAVIQLLT